VPLVSVLMSVHNDERFVREAVDSVMQQTLGDLELIIVDDASTDGTANVLASVDDARAEVLRNEQQLGARVVDRAAAELVATFNLDRIAAALHASPALASLHETIAAAQHKAADVLASVHLPHVPTREELRTKAAGMFAKTRSMEEIVERAHRMILDAVCARLGLAS
jgi:stearoyl-CoA desaturase (delta-9 desaturase)